MIACAGEEGGGTTLKVIIIMLLKIGRHCIYDTINTINTIKHVFSTKFLVYILNWKI